MPTIDELEAYIAEVEQYIASLLPSLEALPTLPQRILDELQRFGPPSLPSFPTLTIHAPAPPPPPPPPPPPQGWLDWLGEVVGGGAARKWAVGLVVGVGVGMVGVYGWRRWRVYAVRGRRGRARRTPLITDGHRREAVVVLGADHPLGAPICTSLESMGYLVIATTSSPSSASDLSRLSPAGHLRVLPLDPGSPLTAASSSTTASEDDVSAFPRRLQVVLSQRSPAAAAGDPYLPAPHLPHVTALVSLLALPTPAPAPLAHAQLAQVYLPHLVRAHVAPLMLVQGLLPLMRSSPLPRTPTIVSLVPALASLSGAPFSAAAAASTTATISAFSSLRRELGAAHDSTQVYTMRVGALALSSSESRKTELVSEAKEAYGAAFETALASAHKRAGSDVSSVTDAIERVLMRPHDSVLASAADWLRGGNVNVGSGSLTYAVASRLPRPVLDAILALPYYISTLRARLAFLPPQPAPRQASTTRAPAPQPPKAEKPLMIAPAPLAPAPPAPATAPVIPELAAAAEEHLSDPESDSSGEKEEEQVESGSESEWEKVREGEERRPEAEAEGEVAA